jgi:transposase
MDQFRLTRRQRRELEQTLTHCHDARFYARLLALRQIDEGGSILRVAGVLGVSRQSVYNWLRACRDSSRLDVLKDRPRPGRPSLWEQRLGGHLEELLRQSPREHGYFAGDWTVPLLAEHLRHTWGQEPSSHTLRRQLHALGYTWKRSRYALEPDPQQEKKTANPA